MADLFNLCIDMGIYPQAWKKLNNGSNTEKTKSGICK